MLEWKSQKAEDTHPHLVVRGLSPTQSEPQLQIFACKLVIKTIGTTVHLTQTNNNVKSLWLRVEKVWQVWRASRAELEFILKSALYIQ